MRDKGITHHGDLRVDTVNKRVVREGELIEFSDLTARLFFTLAEISPEPASAAQLSEKVWDGAFVSDETIAQRIKLLRQALGDSARAPRYIETIRGRGYRLVPQSAKTRIVRLKPQFLALGAVLGALFLGAVYFVRQETPVPEQDVLAAAGVDADMLLTQAQRYLAGHRPDDVDAAIDLYRRALAMWPEDGRVQVGLSFALSTRATKVSGEESDALEAEKLARAAVAVSAQNGLSWHALGYALDAQGRVDDALTSYLHAFRLDPDDRAAASSAAYLLAIRGRYYEALKLQVTVLGGTDQLRYGDLQIAEALDLLGYALAAARWRNKAVLLNPGDLVITGGAIISALRQHKTEEAERLYQTLAPDMLKTSKGQRLLGTIRLAQGRLEDAKEIFAGSDKLMHAAIASMLGDGSVPVQLSAPDSVTWPGQYFDEACVLAARGEVAAAINTLGQAVDLGWRDGARFAMVPFFADLSDNAAFLAIRQRIAEDTAFQRELLKSDEALMAALGIEE
ncbi:winged helix-turn-helix domain-containing protein [Kordiimonas sp.]|uniref:winged helix-turn-helix domain-containing protein n=1 Tax=Kordiimonas sp. TaxID=1970157 RepID=UPI003A90D8B4